MTHIPNQPVDPRMVEDLLFEEGELLDRWELERWLDLYTADAHYVVPTPDVGADASPDAVLYYIADDRERMEARVRRLLSPNAHAERPRSQTRHFLSNIRIDASDPETIATGASFIVHRSQFGEQQTYVGYVSHKIRPTPEGLKIAEKRTAIDGRSLYQGKISIIL